MARQYFGTDGVRGRVGQHPMTVDFALRLASAAARVLAPEGGEVEFDAARLLEMGVTRARTVRSRRGSGGRVEFDPDALVAALAEEVSAWRAANAEEGENAL